MNDMRKIMTAINEAYERPMDDEAYIAAKLYLTPAAGDNKITMAQKLSKMAGIDPKTAKLMIDAIDAYEDIREAQDEWEIRQ